MKYDINSVSQDFKKIADLLFFTDRQDIDHKYFNNLLKSNSNNYFYLWDVFKKSSHISWDNNFWKDRISFLLSLENKSVNKSLFIILKKNFSRSIRSKYLIDENDDITYLQILEYCRVKRQRGDALQHVQSFIIKFTPNLTVDKNVSLTKFAVPDIFPTFDSYIRCLLVNKQYRSSCFKIISSLQQDGASIAANVNFNIIKSILSKKRISENSINLILELISIEEVQEFFKKKYNNNLNNNLLKLIGRLYTYQIENTYFKNFKNLLKIDPSLQDQILDQYISCIYEGYYHHKRARADKISKLIKYMPSISGKKVIAKLSSLGRMEDVAFLVKEFPDLKKISVFL